MSARTKVRVTTQQPKEGKRRLNGEGTYYRAGDGWRGTITYLDPDGVSRRKSVSGPTVKACQDRIAAFREAQKHAVPSGPQTLGQFLDKWLPTQRVLVRPSTYATRRIHITNHIKPVIGNVVLAQLQPSDVARLMAVKTAAGMAPQTVRSIRTTLRLALNAAALDLLVTRNVAALAKPPKKVERKANYLGQDDVRALMVAARADEQAGPLVILGLLSGLRIGELLGLTWADVDVSQSALTVRRGQVLDWSGRLVLGPVKTTDSERTVVLGPTAMATLEKQRERQDALPSNPLDLVFSRPDGRILSRTMATDWLHRLCDAAGLERVSPHVLRHTYASSLLDAGVPMKVISDNLGHRNVTLTAAVYAHVSKRLTTSAADALESWL